MRKIIYSFFALLGSLVCAQSFHTVTFTGNASDFNVATCEEYGVANDVKYYFTFDQSYLYIGAFATASVFGGQDNLTVYLDTDPQMNPSTGTGSASGQSFNNVTGTLPFTANYNAHIERSYQEMKSFDSNWGTAVTGFDVFTTDNAREIRIPLSQIGNPKGIYFTLWMGYNGGTFAQFPTANPTGNNPIITNYGGYVDLTKANICPLSNTNTINNNTYWNGTTWDNGTPDASRDAFITSNFSGSITAIDLTVDSGVALTVNSTVTTSGVVTNNGTITVSDNGNFVQQLGSTYAGSGTLTLSKNSTSTNNIFDLWSSPVASQGMDDIFVTDGSLVREYLTPTDTYATVSPTAAFGKGYAVRGTGTDVVANFTGTPNNGTSTFTLDNTLSTPGNNRYNLVGNPYPSNFNLIDFYNANVGDGSTTGIDPTMYFYNSSAVTDKWGTFNATAGGTWARANAATTETSVKPGQAFFVSARSASTTVSFDNSMRNAASAVFVNKAATSTTEGKYWLELTTPSNNTTGFAVTYGYGASNNYDLYDSKTMSTGADAFYTYLGTEKLAIQGRDYFVSTDIVTLGNKHSAAGQYTISLANKIGLFAGAQPIYLHDKQLGTYTDLQTGNYSFTTNALEEQTRFEIVYQTQALGTSENVKAETKVYRDGEFFVVEATEKITSIEVYDASGRLVLTQQPNRNNARILLSAKGMYVINIKTVKTETSKKVIK